MKKEIHLLLILLTIVSVSAFTPKAEKTNLKTDGVTDSLTLIVHSDLGIPLKASFNGTIIGIEDTLRFSALPMNLLVVGDLYCNTGLIDTLLVEPSDTVEMHFSLNGVRSFYLNKEEKKTAKWTPSNILPPNADYSTISRMKQIVQIGVPPFLPPPIPQEATGAVLELLMQKQKDL